MLSQMSVQALRDTLAQVEPVNLLGVRLLEAHPTPTTASIPREMLKEAVSELIAYTQTCQDLAQNLRQLKAIALGIVLWEYGL
jgi:hypothetical protein